MAANKQPASLDDRRVEREKTLRQILLRAYRESRAADDGRRVLLADLPRAERQRV